jgi:butyryl-CoA dehydrogenase
MFQMMNEERINVGIGATAKVTAAYYTSLEYAQQRLQGRKPDAKDQSKPMIPLIEQADIKRMLLFQRAIAEGSLSLIMQVCMYQDWVHVDEDKERNELLVELLTPILKTYPSEMGVLSTSAAIQIMGGYGYCSDFPAEQYYRDIRIDPIHEGTTGIQGMDVLGRKVPMKNGQVIAYFLEEINKTIEQAKSVEELADLVQELQSALGLLDKVIQGLLAHALQGTIEYFLADSVLFLEFISIVTIAWQWLKQAFVAHNALKNGADSDNNFYTGKLYTARFFYDYELPKLQGLAVRLLSKRMVTVDMPVDCFNE